jgi:asparagine synthase (glutamine-hydrolysing)
VIQVGDAFLARFPEYAERTVYLTEGNVDVYRAADLYVSQRAREIAPAKVVGTYGSEIVRQAVMFKPKAPQTGLFPPAILSQVRQAEETYASVRRRHPVTFAAFCQSPWYHHGILGLEQTQLTVHSPFMDNDFVRTVYQAPKPTSPTDDVRLRLIGDGSAALARIRSDRGVGGGSGRLISAVVRGLQEFTFKAEYAYDYGMPHWLAQIDHRLSRLHLERLFLGRHKLLHFRTWYRNSLADYVKQTLLDPVALTRPYLEPKRQEAIVRQHINGERNYTTEIHKLITLELTHRLFVDAR